MTEPGPCAPPSSKWPSAASLAWPSALAAWMPSIGFMLGSVSTYLIHHVSCSVLVGGQPRDRSGEVVLAVDGSTASKRALQFLLRVDAALELPRASARTGLSHRRYHAMPFLNYPEVHQAGKAVVEECSTKLVASRLCRRAGTDQRNPRLKKF